MHLDGGGLHPKLPPRSPRRPALKRRDSVPHAYICVSREWLPRRLVYTRVRNTLVRGVFLLALPSPKPNDRASAAAPRRPLPTKPLRSAASRRAASFYLPGLLPRGFRRRSIWPSTRLCARVFEEIRTVCLRFSLVFWRVFWISVLIEDRRI